MLLDKRFNKITLGGKSIIPEATTVRAGITILTDDLNGPPNAVPTASAVRTAASKQVNAGNGLFKTVTTGNNAVIIGMLPPSPITGTSGNETTETSHTHSIQDISATIITQGTLANARLQDELEVRGNLMARGDVVSFFSDARLKEDVVPISDPLERLSRLTGVFFRYNDVARAAGFESDAEHVGVLAQDAQRALPHAVRPAPFDLDPATGASRSGEGYLTVQYEKLVPLLIEAVKAQGEEIRALKLALTGRNI
jgi:hypothetical protein